MKNQAKENQPRAKSWKRKTKKQKNWVSKSNTNPDLKYKIIIKYKCYCYKCCVIIINLLNFGFCLEGGEKKLKKEHKLKHKQEKHSKNNKSVSWQFYNNLGKWMINNFKFQRFNLLE